MKFYSMARSLDSFVRVGQELVDDFIGRNDYIGARHVIETNLMPTITGLKLAGCIIPVRSQYAVVLAYCGAFDAADAEMARLAPYEGGLEPRGQRELRNQLGGGMCYASGGFACVFGVAIATKGLDNIQAGWRGQQPPAP